jgi:hypothetical protein
MSDSADSVTAIIRKRFSCRSYLDRALEAEDRERLLHFMATLTTGPLGSTARFHLTAAAEGDADSLRGLGTSSRAPAPSLVARRRRPPRTWKTSAT